MVLVWFGWLGWWDSNPWFLCFECGVLIKLCYNLFLLWRGFYLVVVVVLVGVFRFLV